jgi:hypothetical protein
VNITTVVVFEQWETWYVYQSTTIVFIIWRHELFYSLFSPNSLFWSICLPKKNTRRPVWLISSDVCPHTVKYD